MPHYLLLESITLDPRLQMRAATDPDTVARYAAAYRDGADLPPIVCYEIDGEAYLVDGFHRVAAADQADLAELEVDLRVGTWHDALLAAIAANQTHGLPLTNRDKARIVHTLLDDPELRERPVRELAQLAGVSHDMVARYRREREQAAEEAAAQQRIPGTDSAPTIEPPPSSAPTDARARADARQAAWQACDLRWHVKLPLPCPAIEAHVEIRENSLDDTPQIYARWMWAIHGTSVGCGGSGGALEHPLDTHRQVMGHAVRDIIDGLVARKLESKSASQARDRCTRVLRELGTSLIHLDAKGDDLPARILAGLMHYGESVHGDFEVPVSTLARFLGCKPDTILEQCRSGSLDGAIELLDGAEGPLLDLGSTAAAAAGQAAEEADAVEIAAEQVEAADPDIPDDDDIDDDDDPEATALADETHERISRYVAQRKALAAELARGKPTWHRTDDDLI